MKLTLFSFWRSSCSWRVRIALAWKNLPYEYASVHLVKDGGEQWKADYLARNPQGMVPMLEVVEGNHRRVIAQSLAIVEYLEERVPEPALLPRDPYLRTRTRQLAEIVNSGIQPFQNLSVTRRIVELGADDKAWAHGFIERGLGAFQRAAAETAGRYCVGDSPTLADACLVPQLYHARRFGVDLAPLARLVEIESACAALPAFQAAHADVQPDAQASS